MFARRILGVMSSSSHSRFFYSSCNLASLSRSTQSSRTRLFPNPLQSLRNTTSRPFSVSQRLQQYQRFDKQYSRSPVVNLFRAWGRRPYFYVEVAGLGAVTAGFYVFNLETVPVSGRSRFNIVSDKWMLQLGAQQAQQILQEYRNQILPEWDPRVRQVERVLDRLIPSCGMPNADWQVRVIDSEQANAFVLPGGKVFVFSGILPICGDDNGVAAVLGHEIAHNVARHMNEQVSKGFLLTLAFYLIRSLVGDIPDFATNAILSLAFERPGSRTQEAEADYIGLLMMAQSCYPPEAAVSLWEKMEQAEKDHPQPPQILSTHPSHHNRQLALRKQLPKAREKYEESECSYTGQYIDSFRGRVTDALS